MELTALITALKARQNACRALGHYGTVADIADILHGLYARRRALWATH